jgi:drug/metabolite transporter (DMT)-like permease
LATAPLRTWQLFAVAVAVWGTTWHAIVYQIAHATPEFGVAMRFALAGAIALGLAAWRGERLRFGTAAHLRFAAQGIFMYSLSYLCVYHAERHVPSGLVAVGYSASPLLMGLGSRLLWGTPFGPRFALGGALGICGVSMIFWPEVARAGAGGETALGALFTAGAVGLSAVGALVASRNGDAGLPFWPALGYGMLYSAITSWGAVLLQGQPVAWPAAASWWLSLAYLAVAGSVIAFACFLTLQQRLGAGPASTVGVATTVIALAVSTLLEGYRPGAVAVAGAVLTLTGNALCLGLVGGGRSQVPPRP